MTNRRIIDATMLAPPGAYDTTQPKQHVCLVINQEELEQLIVGLDVSVSCGFDSMHTERLCKGMQVDLRRLAKSAYQ